MRAAAGALLRAFPRSPLRAEALLALGDFHAARSELDEAELFYKRLLRVRSSAMTALARFKLGWLLLLRRELDPALRCFAAVVRRARRSRTRDDAQPGRQALVDYALCCAERRPGEVLATLRRLGAPPQDHALALRLLAKRCAATRPELALAALKEALELWPQTSGVQASPTDLAADGLPSDWLLSARRRLLAEERTKPTAPAREQSHVLAQLAEAWLEAGSQARAVEAAARALALDPERLDAAAILAEQTDDAHLLAHARGSLLAASQEAGEKREALARGLWSLAARDYRRYKAIPAGRIEEKVTALAALEELLVRAAGAGAAEWAVASLWRHGFACAQQAERILHAPAPEGLGSGARARFEAERQARVARLSRKSEALHRAFGAAGRLLRSSSQLPAPCGSKSSPAREGPSRGAPRLGDGARADRAPQDEGVSSTH